MVARTIRLISTLATLACGKAHGGDLMLERVAYALFPTLLLQNTPWLTIWAEQERRDNIVLWRWFFPCAAIIYVGHYFFFDLPMALKPTELWLQFRMSMSGLSLATMLSYLTPTICRSRYYRLPAIVMLWTFCYTQARTIVWYDQSQYLYAFGFVVVGSMLLRTSVSMSIVFASITLATQWSSFVEAGIPSRTMYSGVVATLLFVTITRAKYLGDIRYFLASQQNIDAQRRMIEMNIEFTDRIRAFLPREISDRLSEKLANNRSSILQAVDEVLRPTHRSVACLFSDIRGFTQATKHSPTFLGEGVIPNVRQCNAVIEQYHGIPRKIGDLIFAYYDDPNPYVNLIHCISSGFEISDANKRFNETQRSETHIHRYVLIANGDAIVGNLGGYDSSIEITALGSPVNLLSRIDEVTKLAKFRNRVDETDLVLCPLTAKLLGHLALGCRLNPLPLQDIGATIRDFEEMTTIWLLPATSENRTIIRSAQEYVKRYYDVDGGIRN
jgi:class 3 adenylate cyclase